MEQLTLAGCIIPDADGRILLLHRNAPGRTQWETPGGKIYPGEAPADAASRETEEELGVRVEIVRALGKKDFQEDEHVMTYVWFLARIVEGVPRCMEPSHDNLRYFSMRELDAAEGLSPNARNFVAAVKAGEVSLDLAHAG